MTETSETSSIHKHTYMDKFLSSHAIHPQESEWGKQYSVIVMSDNNLDM